MGGGSVHASIRVGVGCEDWGFMEEIWIIPAIRTLPQGLVASRSVHTQLSCIRSQKRLGEAGSTKVEGLPHIIERTGYTPCTISILRKYFISVDDTPEMNNDLPWPKSGEGELSACFPASCGGGGGGGARRPTWVFFMPGTEVTSA